jgi:tetratricopeptide (TPR) repeat protein
MSEASQPMKTVAAPSSSPMPMQTPSLDINMAERLIRLEKFIKEQDRFNRSVLDAMERLKDAMERLKEEPKLVAFCREMAETMKETKAKINKNALQRRRFEPFQLPTLFAPEHVEKSRKLFNEGVGFYDEGKIDEAIKRWTRAIAANPDNAYAYNNRSIAYSDKEMMDDAERDYRKAVELGIER